VPLNPEPRRSGSSGGEDRLQDETALPLPLLNPALDAPLVLVSWCCCRGIAAALIAETRISESPHLTSGENTELFDLGFGPVEGGEAFLQVFEPGQVFVAWGVPQRALGSLQLSM
jgi:hypothetical protein